MSRAKVAIALSSSQGQGLERLKFELLRLDEAEQLELIPREWVWGRST